MELDKLLVNGDVIKSPLVFFVNGKKVIDPSPDPVCTLLEYLRTKLGLCGTKLGCGEGGCGACTVMISKVVNRKEKLVKHLAVNACLTPVCSVHGLAVTTVEGIGSTKTKLHPVQERIAAAHGSQCGFCTPGIVMSMYSLIRNSPQPTMKDMEIAFQGNLCRCTGYRPIIEGYRTFTKEYQCAMGDKCCKVNGNVCGKPDDDEVLFQSSAFTPYNQSQEPIFPPELMLSDKLDYQSMVFDEYNVKWRRPTTLTELLKIKKESPDAKIIVGNTEVGVEMKFKCFEYPLLVLPNQISELTKIEIVDDGVFFGSSVTLQDMNETLQKLIDEMPEHETRLYRAVVQMLHYFAGKQIRNVASIGGNIMTGSPISDLIPIFTAAEIDSFIADLILIFTEVELAIFYLIDGMYLEVRSLDRGSRKVKMGQGFFTGYRKNILSPDELLVTFKICKTNVNQHFIAYKQAKRRDDDIAIVNMALNVSFKQNTDVIESILIAYGGMAPTVAMANNTSSNVIGMKWNKEMVEMVCHGLIKELPLSETAPGGSILYRKSLTLSLFFKAFLEVSQVLEKSVIERTAIPQNEKSGADIFHTLFPKSVQFFQKASDIQQPDDPVGRPKVHLSGYKQATGEAIYLDDIPKLRDELYLALVVSTKAHAKLVNVDPTKALNYPGVHAFFSAKDLNDHQNSVGPIFHDEEVFVSDTVTSQGQVIGAIVADTQSIAQKASRMVQIQYDELSPIIVSIEDAIKHQSYHKGSPKLLVSGDVDKAFAEAYVIVEGQCRMGGQEHFYLETQATLAIPKEDELEMIASTQHVTEIQKLTSHVTGLPSSKIVVKTKRIGGGFGGKESRGMLVSLPCAIAALRLGRPIRCMLDRDEDMLISGTRHPFYMKYKASATKDGKITGCDIQIYNNGGYSSDLSFSVLERAMFHFENAYLIPNVRVQGWVCKTNIPSNTAFRGFGGPQGMLAAEHIIRDVARAVKKDVIVIAELNLYNEGDRTHYTQEVINCNIKRCWTECITQSNYHKRKSDVDKFNKENKWRKRGIAMVATKFGIAFTAQFLNQAGALVHIYTDGSVLISHAGIEMGQGLHTKMIQVASRALQIPSDQIHIPETSTDKVPNTSATAASAVFDLNGMAILNACNILLERLKSYKEQYPDEGWNSWITKAYFDRVSLSATGFYATPEIGYDKMTYMGQPFLYFTSGAACSEVEIDCLTGDHQVIRTDIVMDLGASLNPAIDIGQIEGGFMQGYGLFTLEEMIYSPTGTVFSRGPGMYKLPGFADIPGEFNVSLLKGSGNPRAIYSSKAVGEPPLFLASSVFFAIKEAITSSRRDNNRDEHFELISPATSARIRLGCQDKFIEQLESTVDASVTPWNIMP